MDLNDSLIVIDNSVYLDLVAEQTSQPGANQPLECQWP